MITALKSQGLCRWNSTHWAYKTVFGRSYAPDPAGRAHDDLPDSTSRRGRGYILSFSSPNLGTQGRLVLLLNWYPSFSFSFSFRWCVSPSRTNAEACFRAGPMRCYCVRMYEIWNRGFSDFLRRYYCDFLNNVVETVLAITKPHRAKIVTRCWNC